MTKQKSYWLKAGFLSFSERMSMMLFGFGSLWILLRLLSKGDFGVWVLFVTTAAIVEVARIGLLQNALVKYLATAKEEDYGKIMTASLILNITLALLTILGLLAMAEWLSIWWNSPELKRLLYWYAITTLMLIPLHQFNFIQQANLQFSGIFWGNFLNKGIFFAFVLGFYLLGQDVALEWLAMVQIVAAGLGAVVSGGFAWRFLRFSKKLDSKWVMELFHYGKYVFGTNLSTMLYKSIDKIMLGSLSVSSTVAVAVYELAIRITNLAEVPTFSMAAVVFPQSARRALEEGKEGTKLLYEKSVGAILAFIIPSVVFVMIFADWIVWIVAGEQYLDAVPVLQWTMLYGLFVPFAVQFGTILDSTGRPQINFYFTMGGAILNVILNYWFISQYDLIGAVYGTLSTYIITFIGMQWLLNHYFDIRAYRVFYYAIDFYKRIGSLIKDKINPRLVTE